MEVVEVVVRKVVARFCLCEKKVKINFFHFITFSSMTDVTEAEQMPLTSLDEIACIVESTITSTTTDPDYVLGVQQMAFFWLGVYQQFQTKRKIAFLKAPVPVLTKDGVVK